MRFVRVIPWEFPDFSVDTHLGKLLKAQHILEEIGYIEGKTHRFLRVFEKSAGCVGLPGTWEG